MRPEWRTSLGKQNQTSGSVTFNDNASVFDYTLQQDSSDHHGVILIVCVCCVRNHWEVWSIVDVCELVHAVTMSGNNFMESSPFLLLFVLGYCLAVTEGKIAWLVTCNIVFIFSSIYFLLKTLRRTLTPVVYDAFNYLMFKTKITRTLEKQKLQLIKTQWWRRYC